MLKVEPEEYINLPIFKVVSNSTLEFLKDRTYKIKIKKGKQLFDQKEIVKTIYIVLKGKMTLYRNSEEGQKRVIFILNEGEIINEVIFDEKVSSANCEAFEDSELLCFLKDDLMKAMSMDFKLTEFIINSMSKKIRRLYRQLKNTVPIRIDKRLAAKLWKLSRDYGIPADEGILINLNITVTYLADMLGSSRETISRCLRVLENEGLIKVKNKKIYVVSSEKLSIYFRGV
ncbi:Crp/Fnr family transcriptional regulator [Fonticella tunisiensis]|uniref:CRP-like cAMP-binding protein n=1 Tax=Fonticella tunisiensis TaxID=1096341 RepID=A0A4R7KT21_9CLOT|nr:Crp/Fnr family transcriptional regulator [Fonticella tunisiensis]TDT62289.1 CRP-like cAMP-binding protein [Fonticella tunisiensis]